MKQIKHRTDLRHALIGGGIAAVIGFGGMALVGTVSSWQAERLVEAVLPSVRFLASTLAAASATILALMLTMLSLTHGHDGDFKVSHYRRLRQISTLCSVLIAGSVLLLLFLAIPIEESESVQARYYIVYYAISAGAAVASGLLVAIVMMLNYAIRNLVGMFIPGMDSDVLANRADHEHPDDDYDERARASVGAGTGGER